jgi:hypothetical protein
MTKKNEIMRLSEWENNPLPEWLFEIDWDEYEKLAAIGYTPEKIAMFYKVKKQEFMYYFMLMNSVLKSHYDRGILFYKAKDGFKMLESAEINVTQAQRLDKLRNENAFESAKDEIIYGGL